jgi:CRP/FNR family cyclic AMP-dependent transcriptional regulator
MTWRSEQEFDNAAFLTTAGRGRRILHLKPNLHFFSQGDPADAIFYLQRGRAKLSVVSSMGKEATLTLLHPGDFMGEESLVEGTGSRTATATAITGCTALRIEKAELSRVVHEEHTFSDLFLSFMLARSMADFDKPGRPDALIPKISQGTLAEMIGTTRSRVNFFMNRFRKLGLIEYNNRIRVHKSLLNVILVDQLPKGNTANPLFLVAKPGDP